MSNVNIRRDVTDKFYRYKMPKLISKIEGKGNGIKTVIPNMSLIAKSLGRPATYPTKYFGNELGAQVICDEKNDRYIVNGAHTAERLATLLDGFITKFVLCGDCKNPETDLVIKGDDIRKDCKACGAILPVDLRHKLCVFIVKNPPPVNVNAAVHGQAQSSSNGQDEEEDELGMSFDAEVPEIRAANDLADDDDDWGQDTSEAAVRDRMKALSMGGAIKKLAGDEDEEDAGDDPIEQFAEFVTSHSGSDSEIIAKAAELSVRDDKVCVVLPQVLFNEKVLTEKQIETRASLIKSFIKSEKCQKGLLGGIERLLGMEHKAALLVKTPIILKVVYDCDLVEEEVFLAWGEKASKKYVDKKTSKEIREKAEPFLNWLKTADEEDDDDEEEDE